MLFTLFHACSKITYNKDRKSIITVVYDNHTLHIFMYKIFLNIKKQNQMYEVFKLMTQITCSCRKCNKKFVAMQIARLIQMGKRREIPHKIKIFFKELSLRSLMTWNKYNK